MPDELYSYERFAGAIRSLYPALAHITDDGELTHAIVSTHPEFKPYVIDPLEGAEAAGAPPSLDYPKLGAPPNPEDVRLGPQAPAVRTRTGTLARPPRRGEGLIEQIGMTPIEGAARVAQGIQDLTQRAVETSAAARFPQGNAATNPRFVGPLQSTWPPPPDAGTIAGNFAGGLMDVGTVLLPGMAANAPLQLARGLGLGTITSEAAKYAWEKGGGPPSWTEFITDVSGLVGGIAGEGLIQGRAARNIRTKAAITDQLGGEAATATADAAREAKFTRFQEATDLARSDAEREAEALSLSRAQTFAAGRAEQARAHAYASAAMDVYKHYPSGVNGGSAWDYFENLQQIRTLGDQVPDEALGLGQPPPTPAGLLGPSGSTTPGPPRFIAGAVQDLNRLDYTSPVNQPIGVPSTDPQAIPPLVDEVGNLLGAQLEGQRPGPPRLGEGKSLVLTPPDAADAIDVAQQDLTFGGRRRPKFPGAAEAIAAGPEPPPAVDQAGLPLTLPPEPDAAGLLPDERAELQRIHDEMSMAPFQPTTWQEAPSTRRGQRGNAAGGTMDLTPGSAGAPVYHDILAEGPTRGAPTRQQVQDAIATYLKTGKGIWGARALKVARDRIQRTGYGGWEPPPSADLSAEPLPTPAPEPTQRTLWSEEGHMVLNIAPDDEAGMRRWLTDQQEEFGDEAWFKAATRAANSGDTFGAWTLATQAAAQSFAGATAAEARSKYASLYPGIYEGPTARLLERGAAPPQVTPPAPQPLQDAWAAGFGGAGHPESPEYVSKVLEFVNAHGTPGLQVEAGKTSALPEAAIPGMQHVVYRATDGTPVAVARVVQDTHGRLMVSDLAADKSRGLLAGRAIKAIGTKLMELGATSTANTLSPDATNFLTKFARRLAQEEGVLNVGPSNKSGMRKWLNDREDAFGDEDWHQKAVAALDTGDAQTAFRIAALSWRSWMPEAEVARIDAERAARPFNAEKVKASVEKQLGEPLPHGTAIGDGGVVTLPGNPGGITPKATDMVMGRTFVKALVDAIEPDRIVHIETAEGGRPADLPKALQVSSQMADEVLRRVPDSVIDDIEEMTGLDRTQQAAHLVRSASQAGKVLGIHGRFVQDNWGDLIHLSPETPIGGPGAASRIEFVPADRAAQIVAYLDTLRRKGMTETLATGLKDFGFEVPTGVDPTIQARVTRQWLRQQQKLNKWGQVIDAVAEKYKDVDKITAAAAMGQLPPIGRGIENASQLMLATLLGQPATWAKIAVSHGIRFVLQAAIEEPIAGLASLARGRYAEATQHFQFAKRALTMDLTQAIPTGMLHSPTSEAMEALFNYTQESVRHLAPDDLRRTLAAIDEFPRQAARLSGAQMDDSGKLLDASPYRRIRNVLTVGIRASQVPTRAIVADATLRSLIYQKGDNPLDVFGSYGGLIEKYGETEAGNMVGAAVSSALNYTFAGEPLPDSLVGKTLSTMRDIPGMAAVVRTNQPFVRFAFATIPRFIWDRMPLAFIADLPMRYIWQRGRLGLGAQLDVLQRHGGLLDTLRADIATSQYKAAVAQTDMISARMQAADASKAFKSLETRAARTGMLPEIHDELLKVSADLQDKIEAAQQAQRTYQQHDQESGILQQTYAQRVNRANQLREIDAPSPEQYIARQATGLALMTLAFAIRGSKDNDGTKYYETRLTPGGAPVDLRHTIVGFAPYLHTVDFFKDVWEQTDHDAYNKARAKGVNLVDAITTAYHGKYTKPELLKEAVADWLSISPVVGDSAVIADLLTGQAPETLAGTSLADGSRHFLGLLGEQLGRLTMPLKALKDVAGSVYEPESHARSPQRPGPETPLAETLLGPAAKNIPGVNELLPERVSPMTGQPVTVQHGLLHQLTGITYYQPLTRFEEELNRTGISYGKAVPKITGDRDFDNLVAKFYAGAVQQHLPTVLNDARYQALAPDLKREILTEVIGSLRAVARVAVASELQHRPGENDDDFRKRMLALAKSPQALAKVERWAEQNEQARQQETKEIPVVQQEQREPEPPSPLGAPPPSL